MEGIYVRDVVEKLVENLQAADRKRLQGTLDKLIEQNNVIQFGRSNGVLYNGIFYKHSTIPSPARGVKTIRATLDVALWDGMQAYLKDLIQVDTDKALIKQLVFCNSVQAANLEELRDSFPDFLLPFVEVEGIQQIPRKMRDPLWMLLSDRRMYTQYQNFIPKMQMYAAMSLMV